METPIQKGKIDPSPLTMKTLSREQKAKEDNENHRLRKSGQTCTFHTPKK